MRRRSDDFHPNNILEQRFANKEANILFIRSVLLGNLVEVKLDLLKAQLAELWILH